MACIVLVRIWQARPILHMYHTLLPTSYLFFFEAYLRTLFCRLFLGVKCLRYRFWQQNCDNHWELCPTNEPFPSLRCSGTRRPWSPILGLFWFVRWEFRFLCMFLLGFQHPLSVVIWPGPTLSSSLRILLPVRTTQLGVNLARHPPPLNLFLQAYITVIIFRM